MVAPLEGKQKTIVGGDWLDRFYKLPAELRLMIWNYLILPGETSVPWEMPDVVEAFRAEKKHILYQEVLEVYFKVKTLDLDADLTLFPFEDGDFLEWLKRGYFTQRFRSLNLRLS